MNKGTLIKLIANPNNISEGDLENLEEIVATYPYCQIAHLLIAKYTQDHESMMATQKIRRAASYTYDRLALRNLVMNVKALPRVKENKRLAAPSLETTQPDTVLKEESLITESSPLKDTVSTETEGSFFDTIGQEDTTKPPSEEDVRKTAIIESETNQEIAPEDLSESRAMELYNEGKADVAIQIYRQLASKNPDKRIYYQNQLSIIIGEEVILDPISPEPDNPPLKDSQPEPENVNSFFENIDDLDTSKSSDGKAYEEINEGKALGLFYDGKIEEARQMYKQLIDMYPENREHFQDQLNNLIKEDHPEKVSEEALNLEEEKLPDLPSLETTISEENQSPEVSQEPEANQATEENNSFFDKVKEETFVYENPYAKPDIPQADLSTTPPESAPVSESIPESEPKTESEPEPSPEPKSEILPEQEHIPNETEENNNASFFDSIVEEANPTSEPPKVVPTVKAVEEAPVSEPEESDMEQRFTEDDNTYEDESQAILLFNQGQNEQAIKIYESLMKRNPQKASYYLSQIDVLKDSQNAFVEQLEKPPVPEDQKVDPDKEEIGERLAIQLFNQGDTDEAIEVYEKLMRKFPEKRNYYASQIEILKS